MSELHGLCGEPTLYPVLPEVGSLVALAVATTPSPPPLDPASQLAFVDHGGLAATAFHSPMTVGQVVHE